MNKSAKLSLSRPADNQVRDRAGDGEALEAAKRLARVANAIRGIDDDCARHAEGLEAYIASAAEGMTLEEAFGLSVRPGGQPWHITAARERRDDAIRQLAAVVGVGSTKAKAEAAAQAIARYQGSAWRKDRTLAEMPAAYVGTPKQYLFLAFCQSLPVPIGVSTLRQILSAK